MAFFNRPPRKVRFELTLDVPFAVDPGATTFSPVSITLDWAKQDVQIRFQETVNEELVEQGKIFISQYVGIEAEDLLAELNQTNFSQTSLLDVLLQRSQQDNKIGAGTLRKLNL